MRGKAVSVMIDIATRYNRSVLGINIAYMHNSKVVVRTIGMQVLRFTHTAANLVKVIKKHLSDYCIHLEQIISFTTDNGKNMIKSAALLNEEYMEECFEEEEKEGEEEYIDNDIFDEDYYENLLKNICAEFSSSNESNLIYNLPCAAHCVHLVIKHAINASPDTIDLLDRCRKLVKKLRTETVRSLLQEFKLKMVILDVETRWNSIFSMVCNIILYDFVCINY